MTTRSEMKDPLFYDWYQYAGCPQDQCSYLHLMIDMLYNTDKVNELCGIFRHNHVPQPSTCLIGNLSGESMRAPTSGPPFHQKRRAPFDFAAYPFRCYGFRFRAEVAPRRPSVAAEGILIKLPP